MLFNDLDIIINIDDSNWRIECNQCNFKLLKHSYLYGVADKKRIPDNLQKFMCDLKIQCLDPKTQIFEDA